MLTYIITHSFIVICKIPGLVMAVSYFSEHEPEWKISLSYFFLQQKCASFFVFFLNVARAFVPIMCCRFSVFFTEYQIIFKKFHYKLLYYTSPLFSFFFSFLVPPQHFTTYHTKTVQKRQLGIE